MKVKASVVLKEALVRVLDGRWNYACAAINDVLVDLRYLHNKDVQSNAQKVFMRFKPKHISDSNKSIQQWWPVGDPERVATLKLAIEAALKAND